MLVDSQTLCGGPCFSNCFAALLIYRTFINSVVILQGRARALKISFFIVNYALMFGRLLGLSDHIELRLHTDG